MEKYSVQQRGKPGQKTSAADQKCPWCGADIKIEGQTKLCPTHGSEPWEGPAK